MGAKVEAERGYIELIWSINIGDLAHSDSSWSWYEDQILDIFERRINRIF